MSNNDQKNVVQPNCKMDNKFNKDEDEKIIDKSSDEENNLKIKALIEQIEIEIKSIALDWKSSNKIEQCVCSIIFDAFNKKVN